MRRTPATDIAPGASVGFTDLSEPWCPKLVRARLLQGISWTFHHCSLERVLLLNLNIPKISQSDFKIFGGLRPMMIG
jgi:hypothetical protein